MAVRGFIAAVFLLSLIGQSKCDLQSEENGKSDAILGPERELHRKERDAIYSEIRPESAEAYVDYHNNFRKQEGADAMNELVSSIIQIHISLRNFEPYPISQYSYCIDASGYIYRMNHV